MKIISSKKWLLILLVVSIVSCESEYTKLVKTELAKNEENDSIFHNLKFGQTKKEFFDICWNLNKEGIATHGPSNSYVQTFLYPKDSTNLTEKMRMLFYAKFNQDNKIKAMDVKFSYAAWAPWNDDLKANKLLPKIQDTLMKWYPGNPFIKVKDDILVKVDGNRQIQLQVESDRDVAALIEDLEYKFNNLKE